jgi:hypothetical protein
MCASCLLQEQLEQLELAGPLEYAGLSDSAESLGFVELPGHIESGEVAECLEHAESLDSAGPLEPAELPGPAGSQVIAELRQKQHLAPIVVCQRRLV